MPTLNLTLRGHSIVINYEYDSPEPEVGFYGGFSHIEVTIDGRPIWWECFRDRIERVCMKDLKECEVNREESRWGI